MIKKIAFIAALAVGTAGLAQTTTPEPVNTTTHNPDVYDGPGPGAPGQPAPEPGTGGVMSQKVETFTPTVRPEYPTCSATVRDNCVQRIDPGGHG